MRVATQNLRAHLSHGSFHFPFRKMLVLMMISDESDESISNNGFDTSEIRKRMLILLPFSFSSKAILMLWIACFWG